jgi:hypothetical protein
MSSAHVGQPVYVFPIDIPRSCLSRSSKSSKGKTILKTSSKKGYYEQATLQNDLRFGEDTMKLQTETVHLGLIRTSNETKINIEERISLDRRTLF